MRSDMGSSSAPAEIRRVDTLTELEECAAITNVVEQFVRVMAEHQRAEIAWASAHGFSELVTTTHELNPPMRAVKAKLGYVERAQTVEVRGELP